MHVRCPHCRNPIEILDDSWDDITCPNCDTSFTLVSAATATYEQTDETIAHFQFVERLGAGAFGTVWKARDTELDRIVAVKIPRKEQLSANESQQFFREARAAAQLKHPNIVSVHEVGREGDTIYIVSDFVDGLSLSDWLSGQRLTFREAAELCAKIAAALEHAHQAGVIHRDLKPSNIMIDADGEPHIMDFGLAKREAGEVTMTVEGQILGTPAYMSPEQAKGEGHDADARSDVYSLGVILFELLSGERPFRGNRRMLLHQVIHEDAPSPRKLNSAIPRDLETICLKCLEKEPQQRYQTAREVAGELQSYLKGEAILARPISRIARAWRWCRRNPLVAGLSTAVMLVLLVGIAVSCYFAIEASDNSEHFQNEFHRAEGLLTEKDGLLQEKGRLLDHETQLAKKLATSLRDQTRATARAKAETDRADRLVYASRIARAQLEWNTGDASVAWKSLDSCRWDIRGWEHDYLYSLFNRNHQTLWGHTGTVNSVAFSLDGKRIVSGGYDKTLKVWDVSRSRQTK